MPPLYNFSIHTPRIFICCCPSMQRNVSTVQIHHGHTAKFTCVGARRCRKTFRLDRFTMGTPRNLHVLLLADAGNRLDCTDLPWAQREIYMCCCSPMQRSVLTGSNHLGPHETSQLYKITMGTARNVNASPSADSEKRLDWTGSP